MGAYTTEGVSGPGISTTPIINSKIYEANITKGAVGTHEIADGAVTAAKLAAGAGGAITDASITSAAFAAGAVNTAALGAAAVATANLAAGAVTAPKLNLAGLKVIQASGVAAAGPVTTTGTAVGDRIIAVLCTSANTASAALFQTTVTVINQIQQSSATDLSASRFIFLLLPAAA